MRRALLMCLSLLFATAVVSEAQEVPSVTIEEVVTGLDNPCGVAMQPKTGKVFVAESGAGRVLRVEDKNKTAPAITGFSLGTYGPGPTYSIGPLGLAFLDEKRLVVGGGGKLDGDEQTYLFELPEDGSPLEVSAARHQLGPVPASEETATGEGNFYGIAVNKKAIFVTANGDDTKGWVLKSQLPKSGPKQLEPFIATKAFTGVDAPTAITISPEGHLVVGQMGEIGEATDSLLTFYDVKTGQMLLNLPTGLKDITALAYSPKQKRLYALDFSWNDPAGGGLYRLDQVLEEGRVAVRPVLVQALTHPTAMAFGTDGSLYVSIFGTSQESNEEKPGKLLRLAARF